jgi:hypothetical protein
MALNLDPSDLCLEWLELQAEVTGTRLYKGFHCDIAKYRYVIISQTVHPRNCSPSYAISLLMVTSAGFRVPVQTCTESAQTVFTPCSLHFPPPLPHLSLFSVCSLFSGDFALVFACKYTVLK